MKLSDYEKLHVGAKVHNSVYGYGVVTEVRPRPSFLGWVAYEADFAGGVFECSLFCTTSIEPARFEPKPGDLVTWGTGTTDYVFVGELPGGRVVLVEETGEGEEWTNSRAVIRPREEFYDLRPAKKPPLKLKVNVEIAKASDGTHFAVATSEQEGAYGEKLDGAVASRTIEFEIER